MPGFDAAKGVGARRSRAWRNSTYAIAGEIPQHKGKLTLGEILMEPILLNPRIGGELNAANVEEEQWETYDRIRRPQCKLMRSSTHRRARADTMWARIKPMAEAVSWHYSRGTFGERERNGFRTGALYLA